ncbi:hypothetical protein BC940DRAFT_345564 [Gongronella butleri]|nr:hypothetical protein BC940DRAFT_345564 [Gongronella butleri]
MSHARPAKSDTKDFSTLLQENERLRKRIKQAEERAKASENGFVELSSLRHTQEEKTLRDYKEVARRRAAASDDEARQLHELVHSYERDNANVREQLNDALNEVNRLKTLLADMSRPRVDEKANEKLREELAASRTKISSLEAQAKSIMEFFGKTTGMYLEQQVPSIPDATGELLCTVHGRLGKLVCRLVYMTRRVSDKQPMMRYLPMLGYSDKMTVRNLPEFYRKPFEFKEDEAREILWRVLNVVNQPTTTAVDNDHEMMHGNGASQERRPWRTEAYYLAPGDDEDDVKITSHEIID